MKWSPPDNDNKCIGDILVTLSPDGNKGSAGEVLKCIFDWFKVCIGQEAILLLGLCTLSLYSGYGIFDAVIKGVVIIGGKVST